MWHSSTIIIVLLLIAVSTSGFRSEESLRVQSGDLNIAEGSQIRLDGKMIGTAPCEITLQSNRRHKLEAKSPDGTIRSFVFTTRAQDRTDQTKAIPAWFLNPDLARGEYPGYDTLAAATATSRMIAVAISKAEMEATAKLAQGSTSVFSSQPRSDYRRMLDSAKSKNFPERTRGQMDSLSRATGGRTIVTSFSGTVSRTVLQYEIQKIDNLYRVYVLVGKRKG